MCWGGFSGGFHPVGLTPDRGKEQSRLHHARGHYLRFLTRMVELELIDRKRVMVEVTQAPSGA